jgi:hypothetical protein
MAPNRNRKKKKNKPPSHTKITEIRKKEKPQRKFIAQIFATITILFTSLTIGMTYAASIKHGSLSLPLGIVLVNIIVIFACGFIIYDWLRK